MRPNGSDRAGYPSRRRIASEMRIPASCTHRFSKTPAVQSATKHIALLVLPASSQIGRGRNSWEHTSRNNYTWTQFPQGCYPWICPSISLLKMLSFCWRHCHKNNTITASSSNDSYSVLCRGSSSFSRSSDLSMFAPSSKPSCMSLWLDKWSGLLKRFQL